MTRCHDRHPKRASPLDSGPGQTDSVTFKVGTAHPFVAPDWGTVPGTPVQSHPPQLPHNPRTRRVLDVTDWAGNPPRGRETLLGGDTLLGGEKPSWGRHPPGGEKPSWGKGPRALLFKGGLRNREFVLEKTCMPGVPPIAKASGLSSMEREGLSLHEGSFLGIWDYW